MNTVLEIFSKCEKDDSLEYDEEIDKLASQVGWENVLNNCLRILSDEKNKESWYMAAAVISWASEDKIPMPKEKAEILALLYWCLEKHPDLGEKILDGENLVWSIASSLYQISYMSSWDPRKEKEIQKRIELFRGS